jgi:hypothetical protein
VHNFPLVMARATRGKKSTSSVLNFPLVAAGMARGKNCTRLRTDLLTRPPFAGPAARAVP